MNPGIFFRGRPQAAQLISILLLYLLLIFLVLFLSRQVLLDISQGLDRSNNLAVILVLILPLALLLGLVIQVLRLLRERAKGMPGRHLKLRLVLLFALSIFLAAIPQGILSLNFIETTTESWLGDTFGQALEGGLDIALEYHHDKTQNLRALSESRILPQLLQGNFQENPAFFFQQIQELNPAVHGVQIYHDSGREVLAQGDERSFIPFRQVQQRLEGALPKESRQDVSILRVMRHFFLSDQRYTLILSTVLPPGFDLSANYLSRAMEVYAQLRLFNLNFRTAVVFFYLIFSLPILLLAFSVSFILSNEILRPLINLEEATRRVADGDFSYRILSQPGQELSTLVNSFNAMVSELEASRVKILQTEKITAWQEIAQRLAHEIRNPLTPIRLSAERILNRYHKQPEDLGRIIEPAVGAIIQEVTRLDNMLREFRDFARLPVPKKVWIEVQDLIDEAASAYVNASADLEIRYRDLPRDLMVHVDRGQIVQVFTNLIKNAAEAMNHQGQIRFWASLVKKGYSSYCRIQVQDTGPGIPQEEHEKVFNPYYTTKAEGTGLGLSIVERIIFDHRGKIWFESQLGHGTTFFIDLPLDPPKDKKP